MNYNDIISIAAVITTTVVAVVSIFLNHRSNLKHQLFLEKLRIYKELMVIVSQSTSKCANSEEAAAITINPTITPPKAPPMLAS